MSILWNINKQIKFIEDFLCGVALGLNTDKLSISIINKPNYCSECNSGMMAFSLYVAKGRLPVIHWKLYKDASYSCKAETQRSETSSLAPWYPANPPNAPPAAVPTIVPLALAWFDISIKPFEDCCTVYIPKNPVIKPNLAKCEELESRFDYKSIIEDIVNNTKYLVVNPNMDIDLAMYGLEVGPVIDEIVTKGILKK